MPPAEASLARHSRAPPPSGDALPGQDLARSNVAKQRPWRWDEFKLLQLGYRQEYRRSFTLMHCVGFGLAAMTPFTFFGLYVKQGLAYGGPVVIIWGWLALLFPTMCSACSMAEMLSAFPTSAGGCYWTWVLSKKRWRGYLCWLTGWFMFFGEVLFLASLEVALTNSLGMVIHAHTAVPGKDGVQVLGGYHVGELLFLGLLAAVSVLPPLVNSIHQDVIAAWATISALWNVIALVSMIIVLLCVAPTHQSTEYAWFAWTQQTESTGITSRSYMAMGVLLMCAWQQTGFHTITNVAEEVFTPDVAGSWGIIISAGSIGFLGLGLLLSLNYSTQSVAHLWAEDSLAGANVLTLIWDVFASRYGSGTGAIPFMYLVLLAAFGSCLAMSVSAGRLIHIFARNDAFIAPKYFRKLQANQLPVHCTWLVSALAFVCAVPAAYSATWNATLDSASVMLLASGFSIPFALVVVGRGMDGRVKGPFNLGRMSKPCAFVACCWACCTMVLFSLPYQRPVTLENMNYAPCMLALVLIVSCITWHLPRYGAKHWFRGPRSNMRALQEPVSHYHTPHDPSHRPKKRTQNAPATDLPGQPHLLVPQVSTALLSLPSVSRRGKAEPEPDFSPWEATELPLGALLDVMQDEGMVLPATTRSSNAHPGTTGSSPPVSPVKRASGKSAAADGKQSIKRAKSAVGKAVVRSISLRNLGALFRSNVPSVSQANGADGPHVPASEAAALTLARRSVGSRWSMAGGASAAGKRAQQGKLQDAQYNSGALMRMLGRSGRLQGAKSRQDTDTAGLSSSDSDENDEGMSSSAAVMERQSTGEDATRTSRGRMGQNGDRRHDAGDMPHGAHGAALAAPVALLLSFVTPASHDRPSALRHASTGLPTLSRHSVHMPQARQAARRASTCMMAGDAGLLHSPLMHEAAASSGLHAGRGPSHSAHPLPTVAIDLRESSFQNQDRITPTFILDARSSRMGRGARSSRASNTTDGFSTEEVCSGVMQGLIREAMGDEFM